MKAPRTIFAPRCLCALLLVFSIFTTSPGAAVEKDFPEAKIKAAYLFNFLRFIEWPPGSVIDTHICVIGQKNGYQEAFKSLRSQSLNDQRIVIRELDDIDNPQTLLSCQIIFLTSVASHRQKMVFNTLKGSKTLTVGENSGFVRQGGMINFIEKDSKIRFEINLRTANEAGLRITSKILRIADLVINGELHE
jgi:hypothetical protein